MRRAHGEHRSWVICRRLEEKAQVQHKTVRRLVKDEPGVIKIRQGRKKAHTTYSVPESTARRIHTRLLNVA
jgi:hypothetical protein